MKPNLRRMQVEDRAAVASLLRRTPEFLPYEVIVAEELVDCYLADPVGSGYFFWVAEVDEVVVGYICFGPTPLTVGTWDIYWMAVSAECQGKGIGTGLLALAEEEIRKSGGRMALIETSSKPLYEKTVRFYLGLKWVPVSRIPDFYSPGDDKITLQKKSY